MRDDEIPEWESRLRDNGGLGDPPRRMYPRRIEDVRAAAARSRARSANKSKATEIAAKIFAGIIALIIITSTLAMAAAIVGGAYWLLTGEPIF